MAETEENLQNTNITLPEDDNVEYEYVELSEGEELPEGYEYEYEYVEVPEDGNPNEISELNVLGEDEDESNPEEVELASAAEIEAAIRPIQLDDEPEENSIALVDNFPQAENEVGNIPPIGGFSEASIPELSVSGSEMNDEDLIGEVEDPQVGAASLEEDINLEEHIPPLDIVPTNNETTENQELNASEPQIRFNNEDMDSHLDDAVINQNDESIFVAADHLNFQNNEINDVKAGTNWFKENNQGLGVDVGSVEIEAEEVMNKAEDNSSLNVEDYLEPGTIVPPAEIMTTDLTEIQEPSFERPQPVDNVVKATPSEEITTEVFSETKSEGETVLTAAADEELPLEEMAIPSLAIQEQSVETEDAAVEFAIEETSEIMPETEEISLDDLIGGDAVLDFGAMNEDGIEKDISLPELEQSDPVEDILHEELEPTVEFPTNHDSQTIEEEMITQSITDANEPTEKESNENVVETISTEPVVEMNASSETAFAEEKESMPEPESVEEEFEFSSPSVNEEQTNDFSKQEVAENVPEELQEISPIVVKSEEEQENIINPEINFPNVVSCSAEMFSERAAGAYLVSKDTGIQSFRADNGIQTIALNEIDFSENELRAWNLVIFSQEIKPLTEKVSELSMPRHKEVNRLVTLVKAGQQKANFFNEDKLTIINATDACVAVKGRFVCGDLQTNSGVIINDYVTIHLQDFVGKALEFASPVSGLISGPNGTLLYFFNIRSLLIPNSEIAKVDAEKLQYKISKWYSGTLNDKYFEFDATSQSTNFEGNEQMNAIHVNVNNSSYGWNVTFDNGLSMNLRDLREYQTRFGKMPSPNGVISYGQTKLTFSKVERIVVYESAQYFFYS